MVNRLHLQGVLSRLRPPRIVYSPPSIMGRLASDKDPLLVLRRATGRHTIRQYLYGALTIVVLFFIYRWITNPPKQPFIDTQRTVSSASP
ncbi:hypothetical protein L596_002096 [Steinernema carpocapsae]|uniref:Uncharacterized protein n=1 Tax=Steinernema carpocapsae TaxID=34508 RepID=A0A4V6I7A8_STECR|nr:hypothetical protein L596_002096 [Steinernema carpocapsae]